jgi:maleate isomerase
MPDGVAVLNARLVSDSPRMEQRLKDYVADLPAAIQQFGGAPLDALALATTGPSYFLEPEEEDRLIQAFKHQTGIPLATAAVGVCQALHTLGCQRIALVSPYPDSLNGPSVKYWEARGFGVNNLASVIAPSGGFHPIYTLHTAELASSVLESTRLKVDCVLILGTGAPSLRLIAEHNGAQPPLLSCMFCLAWYALVVAGAIDDTRATLEQWLVNADWMHPFLGDSSS